MMQMGYADIGTLLDVFSALRKELSAAEHELIVAYFALQVHLFFFFASLSNLNQDVAGAVSSN
jgi:hypothetical protein